MIPAEVVKTESMAVQVLRFMEVMDQPPGTLGETVPAGTLDLANKLMFHPDSGEVEEARIGWEKFCRHQSLENLTEFVDGAIDSIYVILWTLNKLGVPADACFAEVQRSNMAKLWPDGKVHKNEFGKVQKPPGWTPPQLHELLLQARDAGKFTNGVRNG